MIYNKDRRINNGLTKEKCKDEVQFWPKLAGILAGAPTNFMPLSKTPLGWSRYPGCRPPRYLSAAEVLVEDSRGVRAKDTLTSNIIRFVLPTLWYALYTPYTALIGMTYSEVDLCKYTLGCLFPDRLDEDGKNAFKVDDFDGEISRAYKLAMNISANIKLSYLRLSAFIFTYFFGILFGGDIYIDEEQVAKLKQLQKTHNIVYLPTHRSHLDVILMSYVLFSSGLNAPIVASGDNLNFPLFNRMMRGTGGFFIRRSSKGHEDSSLYKKVLASYIEALMINGHNIEFFIEGGRSRDGYIMKPKLGLLSNVINAFVDGNLPRKGNVACVPVNITYDFPLEERGMIGELLGKKKKSESLYALASALCKIFIECVKTLLFHQYSIGDGGHCGCAIISFGQPITLKPIFKTLANEVSKIKKQFIEEPMLINNKDDNSNNEYEELNNVQIRKSLERGNNPDIEAIASIFLKGSEDRYRCISAVGTLVHERMKCCQVIPASSLMYTALLLTAMKLNSTEVYIADVYKTVCFMQNSIEKFQGRFMSLHFKDEVNSFKKITKLAKKFSERMSISFTNENSEATFDIKRQLETCICYGIRSTPILLFLAPASIISCAILALSQGWTPTSHNMNTTSIDNPKFENIDKDSLNQPKLVLDILQILRTAVMIRELLSPDMDLLFGTDKYMRTVDFAPILAKMIDSQNLIKKNNNHKHNGSKSDIYNITNEEDYQVMPKSYRKSVDSIINKLIRVVMNENKDAQMILDSQNSNYDDAMLMSDNDTEVVNHVCSLRHSVQLFRENNDKFYSYSLLLSPMLYTYQTIFKILHDLYINKTEYTEKELVSLIHNQIKTTFNVQSFMKNGTFNIPTITLIRRVIQKLRSDNHEENLMPYPVLVKLPEGCLMQKPPKHTEMSSSLLRTFSDASVSTECETPKKINKNGGLGDVSNDILRIRREIRDSFLLLNVAEQLKSFIFLK